METYRRPQLAGGLVLVMLGVIFLAMEVVPGLRDAIYLSSGWPLGIVAVAVLLAIIGALTGASGMAIPACIVGGIGALLWWQNATGNWESWAYAWALIPGFVGIGMVIHGLFDRRWDTVWAGVWLMVISTALFLAFSAFLGGPNWLGVYWPLALIVLGVLLLVRRLVRA